MPTVELQEQRHKTKGSNTGGEKWNRARFTQKISIHCWQDRKRETWGDYLESPFERSVKTKINEKRCKKQISNWKLINLRFTAITANI